MHKRNKILTILYIALLVVCFFEIENSIKDIIFAAIFIIFSIVYIGNRKKLVKSETDVKRARIKILKALTILMMIFLVASIIVLITSGLSDLIPSNLVTIGMILICLYIAYLCNDYFGDSNVKNICIAVLINYAFVMLIYFINILTGVTEVTYDFLGLKPVLTLEIHELAFIAGILLIYLLFSRKCKRMRLITALIFAVVILDLKRISIIAFAVILLIYIINKIFIKNEKKTAIFARIVTYVIVFSYLVCMTFFLDQTLTLVNNLGINMSWRDHFYRMINENRSQYYPLLGTGIRSTDYRMSIDPRWNFIGAIHSDVLRLSIENGAILFAVYVLTYVSAIPRVLKKILDQRSQLVYSFLMLFTFICYTTDNLFTYYRFSFVLFSLIFVLTNTFKGGRISSNEKEA